MSANLNLNDGYKEFTINNDPERVIRINPADYGMLERIETAFKNINKLVAEEQAEEQQEGEKDLIEELEKAAGEIRRTDECIKEQIDHIFNSPVSEVVFGRQSPQSMVGGLALYERFLHAVIPEIKKEIIKEQKASQARIGKYTKAIK